MNHGWKLVAIATLLLLVPASWSVAQDAGTPDKDTLEAAHSKRPYSPWAGGGIPNKVFWGDTHLHTSFSMDAGAFGARMGPEDAYRFARGDEVESATAGRARLARPLDFLVVADHSDNMGWFPDLFAGSSTFSRIPRVESGTTRSRRARGWRSRWRSSIRSLAASFPKA